MQVDRRNTLILLGVCLALFFLGLGRLPLFDTDEGMHAWTSRAMVESGDWVTTRFNGENFYDKPAFFNWFVSIAFVVLGFTELAARLPAALFGTGCVALTYLLGRRMFGPRPALLAAVILASSGEVMVVSRVVLHDISLLFGQTAALTCFYFALAEGRRRTTWLLFTCAALALAVLAKGPVGLLVPGAVMALFLALTRRLGFIRQIPFLRGGLLFLLIAAPWYVLISLRNEDYARYFFLEKNLGSFFSSEAAGHVQPFYYYAPAFLAGFLPWSPFLPAAFAHARRGLRTPRREALLFLLVWFGFTFVFFSAASSKLATYVLLLFPAASLLVGVAWSDLMEGAMKLQRGFARSSLAFLVVAGIALAVTVWATAERFEGELGIRPWIFASFAGILTGGWGLSFALLVLRRPAGSFAVNAGTLLAATLFAYAGLGSTIGAFGSCKAIVPELERRLAPGEQIVCFRKIVGVGDSALFYTGRTGRIVRDAEELREYLAAEERVYCLVKTDDLDRAGRAADAYHVVHREGGRILISNRPDGP